MADTIRRGDIFYIDRYGIQIGSEQRSGRPGVIVSCKENNQHSDTVEIAYCTTAEKTDLPTHVRINSTSRESIVLCEQVTTVSVERLGNYIGQCTKDEMFQIDVALVRSLGIKIPELKDLQKELQIAAEERRALQAKQEEAERKEAEQFGPVSLAEDAAAILGENGQLKDENGRLKVECETYKTLYKDLLERLVPRVK